MYLVCNKIDQLSIKKENNNSLALNLQTVCACPNGCHSVMNTFSPGTYIVIVFTSVSLSYFILGKFKIFYQVSFYNIMYSQLLGFLDNLLKEFFYFFHFKGVTSAINVN